MGDACAVCTKGCSRYQVCFEPKAPKQVIQDKERNKTTPTTTI